jgi:hypothetical protein
LYSIQYRKGVPAATSISARTWCPRPLKAPSFTNVAVVTQDRVTPYYAPNSSIKHSKSDSKDRSQEIL